MKSEVISLKRILIIILVIIIIVAAAFGTYELGKRNANNTTNETSNNTQSDMASTTNVPSMDSLISKYSTIMIQVPNFDGYGLFYNSENNLVFINADLTDSQILEDYGLDNSVGNFIRFSLSGNIPFNFLDNTQTTLSSYAQSSEAASYGYYTIEIDNGKVVSLNEYSPY